MEGNDTENLPETPAHIFAYRAFQTALFGTPAVKEGNQVNIELTHDTAADDRPQGEPEDNIQDQHNDNSKSATSPIKSILLTPGTVGPVRKTVTFSGLCNESNSSNQDDSKNLKQQLGGKLAAADFARPSDIRRTLFQCQPSIQETELIKVHDEEQNGENQPRTTYQVNPEPSGVPHSAEDAEHTTDLNSPKSASGHHWKNEYQREHDKTKAEMKRLIRYSQIAKSYAAKRDREANRMREKLEEAEAKVQSLEETVMQLASELGNARLEDNAQAQLIDDLALQTANAVKYKEKASRYRAALCGEGCLHMDDADHENQGVRGGDRVVDGNGPQPHKELLAATAKTEQLEQENAALRSTILRVKEEMQRYEERHHKWQEGRKRRDERSAARRKALEEELARARAENLQLMEELRAVKEPTKKTKADENQKPAHARRSLSVDETSRCRNSEILHGLGKASIKDKSKEVRLPRPSRVSSRPGDREANTPKLSGNLPNSLRPWPQPSRMLSTSSPVSAETLDLLGLAEGSIAKTQQAQNRNPSLGLTCSGSTRGNVGSATQRPTGETLWENLRRRTSISLTGTERSSLPGRVPHSLDGTAEGIGDAPFPKGIADVAADKENINPVTL